MESCLQHRQLQQWKILKLIWYNYPAILYDYSRLIAIAGKCINFIYSMVVRALTVKVYLRDKGLENYFSKIITRF